MNVEINKFNHARLFKRYKSLFIQNLYWHKIVVNNVEGLDRDAVLKTLMKSCIPADFIPVQYVSSKNVANFLVRNCSEAIQKLCDQNLLIRNPFNDNKPFEITIKLCYAVGDDLSVDIHENLRNVLMKRFCLITGILNLDNFATDSDLEEYCALSQPKLFFYVLHIAKDIPFKILSLVNNSITSLSSFEALDSSRIPLTVDLKNNCIENISELNFLKHLNVTELWLDGNPVCDNYSEISYSKAIKVHVKQLEKLDGINIKSLEFPRFRRNFLCDLTGYDLVDQFLEHFFTLYDSNNRLLLTEMYHRDAIFSLTSRYIPLQSTSSTTQLKTYTMVSRNLRLIFDLSRNTQNLFIGPYLISNTLSSLPMTEHDPYSFTADLMMHTEEMTVLVVSGVFRECSTSLLRSDRLLGFTRTFVLLPGENGEYSIINEMLNVANATTAQVSKAFRQTATPRLECTNMPRPQDIKDLQDMIDAFKAITGLSTDWARRCLEEYDYDLKQGLELFIQLLKLDKIPKSAMDSEEKKTETSLSKLQNPFVNRKLLLNEPDLSSFTVTVENTNPTVILPISKTDVEIKSRPQTAAVGIAKPINRETPTPTQLQAKPLPTPVKKNTNTDVKKKKNKEAKEKMNKKQIVDIIDLTESSRGPSNPAIPSLFDKILKPEDLLPSSNKRQPNKITISTASTGNVGTKKSETDKADLELEQKFQMGPFMAQFKRVEDMYKKKGHKEALPIVEKLLLGNRIHYAAFEVVFTWYYKTNLDEAREMKEKIILQSNKIKPYLSVWQLRLLVATCECLHGNFELGEAEFRKLIEARIRWARPITEFCRILLKRQQIDEARTFLKPFLTNHSIASKMRRIATDLSREFKVTF